MADIRKVKEQILLMTSLEESDLEKFSVIIQDAIESFSKLLKDDGNMQDSRIVGAVAAFCANRLSIISGENNIVSFSAGDVSVSTNASKGSLSSSERLLDEYMLGIKDLVRDDAFLFKVI